VHTCNPSYGGGRNGKIMIQSQSGHKVSETLSPKTTQVWWLTPVVPDMQEVEAGGLWPKIGPGQSVRSYLKNN
jgi:hypothetical protein